MKKLLSKVAHNRPKRFFFQSCRPAQNLPKTHFLFHKNVSLHDFYIMTLPAATPRVGSKFTKSQIYSTKLTLHPHIRFYSNFNPSLLLTYYLTYLRSRTFQTYLGPKNWTLEVQNFPKLNFFHFFDWG